MLVNSYLSAWQNINTFQIEDTTEELSGDAAAEQIDFNLAICSATSSTTSSKCSAHILSTTVHVATSSLYEQSNYAVILDSAVRIIDEIQAGANRSTLESTETEVYEIIRDTSTEMHSEFQTPPR